MTPGRPTRLAKSSSQWMGLKSPEAPAYWTSCARSSTFDRSGNSSPTSTSSKLIRVAMVLPGRRTPADERGPGHAHELAPGVRHGRLDGQELVRPPGGDLRDARP